MPLAGTCLDERWLDFVRQTAVISDRYPEFASMRQVFFKRHFVRGDQVTAQDRLKSVVRRLARRDPSSVPQALASGVEVAFWLDNRREVLTEAVLPVWRQLQALGVRTALICSADVASAVELDHQEVVIFRPAAIGPSGRWEALYNELRARVPELSSAGPRSLFLQVAQEADGITVEATRILKRLRPKLLVLPVDQVPPGSAACRAAHHLGIESLVLLHGAVSAYNAPVVADRMAVWGEVSRDQMVEIGVDRPRLVSLGSPRHDGYSPASNRDACSRLKSALGLRELPTFTFFSNGNDLHRNSREAVEGCASWLEAAAEELGDRWNFVVKLHPNEDGSLYSRSPRLRVFKSEVDSYTALAGSEVVGALCSTVLSEALLLRRPVLQFYAEGWPHLADNWQRNLSLRTQSANDLQERLTWLLSHSAREALAREQEQHKDAVFANHGCATKAVAHYVMSRLGSAPRAEVIPAR